MRKGTTSVGAAAAGRESESLREGRREACVQRLRKKKIQKGGALCCWLENPGNCVEAGLGQERGKSKSVWGLLLFGSGG
ncbi:hypothetical protein POPTR_019G129780v4 [Populus trichocarpa]|uniref:Uncharacterized protein n=1 Tax=Populus trichocarpa TaxID=3694 RepID=A0ACC0RLM3_POPTR|nr:hypothetical protein POPTR_019G129780v4 [Populus trichocarpa]